MLATAEVDHKIVVLEQPEERQSQLAVDHQHACEKRQQVGLQIRQLSA